MLFTRPSRLVVCSQVEAEGKLYSVPEDVEFTTPASTSPENWWEVCVLVVVIYTTV